MNRGFTLVELMVSVAIFAVMTTLLVAKYGTFNQSVLMTNLGYDIALTIRTAQTYGMSVKSPLDTPSTSGSFQYAYGVEFSTASGGGNQTIILYADIDGNKVYSGDSSAEKISSYAVKRGAVVSGLCAANTACTTSPGISQLDLLFKRPDPNALICYSGTCYQYGRIDLKGTDNSIRSVIVRENGQISVED